MSTTRFHNLEIRADLRNRPKLFSVTTFEFTFIYIVGMLGNPLFQVALLGYQI